MNVIYNIVILIVVIISVAIGIHAKSWEALTAIGTLLLAIATFTALSWDRKKEKTALRRQVAEAIFHPLIKKISFIISDLENNVVRGITTFDLASVRDSNIYLYSQVKKRMANEIETFDVDLIKFRNLSVQQTPKLATLISKSVVDAAKGHLPENLYDKAAQQNDRDFSWSYFSCLIGGKNFHISLWQLILKNQSLDDAIREAQNAPDIFNKKIGQEKFNLQSPNAMILDEHTDNLRETLNKRSEGRQRFEEALKSIKDGAQKDSELLGYVMEWQNVYRLAVAIKKKLKSFD